MKKAYVCGKEVVILEFRDSKIYGREARVFIKNRYAGLAFWVPADKIVYR